LQVIVEREYLRPGDRTSSTTISVTVGPQYRQYARSEHHQYGDKTKRIVFVVLAEHGNSPFTETKIGPLS
jgi:hypothetical protein